MRSGFRPARGQPLQRPGPSNHDLLRGGFPLSLGRRGGHHTFEVDMRLARGARGGFHVALNQRNEINKKKKFKKSKKYNLN